MKKLLCGLLNKMPACVLLLVLPLNAFDFPKFYRASYFFGEPRLAKNKLTSLDITAAAGSTCKTRDCAGNTTCLLDMYGLANMQKLGAGIPCKDPTNPADIALIYLSRIASRDRFAHLSFSGKFELIEAIFSITQNFTRGFFAQLFAPVKRMKVCNINYRDLSPTDSACPNINHPYWQFFLHEFHNILAHYCLSLCDWCDTEIGDIAFLLGWTINYQETTVLDYIDLTAKLGVSIPSGREMRINRAFDVPPGYDGHTGIPLQLDASIGAFEWLTLGVHGDFIPFFSKTKNIRMKTDYNQCGFIKLAQGCAHVKKGFLFDVGAFMKADHFSRGLSLLVGYTYSKKYKDELTPQNICLFDTRIVNTDPMLHEWEMHTMHFAMEYDFAHEGNRTSPRIALFYNWQIAGKMVFKNSMAGGAFGIDIGWDF